MRREVFLRQDIIAALRAIAYAAGATTDPEGPHGAAYRRGFQAALVAVGLAFDIPTDPAELPAGGVRVYAVPPRRLELSERGER